MKRFLVPIFLILLSFFFSRQGYRLATVLMEMPDTTTVVIDAGHESSHSRTKEVTLY
jgi:hypothetical protein